jgi:hypothetical protein
MSERNIVSLPRGSNRLAILAGEIRAAHDAAARAQKTAVERARDAGNGLIEAKSLVASKGWLAWLKTMGINERTARDYIRLARLSVEKAATVADLGLRAALETIRDEDRDDEPAPDAPAEWTEDQLDRKARAERGECVVANMRSDDLLIAWARYGDDGVCAETLAHEQGRFVRIDRATDWGNPFEMPADGERWEVIGKFEKFYLPNKSGLLKLIPQLRGKVLGCWCHPEDCHGHVIASVVNEHAETGQDPAEIAEELSHRDG